MDQPSMPRTGGPATRGAESASCGDSVPVVLAGIHGYGRWHLANLERLSVAGSAARLAGICDTRPPAPETLAGHPDVTWDADLGALIDRVGARVVVLCTPIHTHAELALVAARRGCHVLLEKPPAATLASFTDLLAALEGYGVACQVGFQDLASAAVGHVQDLLAAGAVGNVRGIGAAGAWIRDVGYFGRARWAGRRQLDGLPVVDGVLSNPFAHAVASALVLDGSAGDRTPRDIEVELYRAHDIEADDTSCLRLRTDRGTPVVVAATLCAEHEQEPAITVYGTSGRIELRYKKGQIKLHRSDDPDGAPGREWVLPGEDLLDNLIAHVLDDSLPLLVPASSTTGFMHVLEAIRTAADPVPIPTTSYREDGSGPTFRRIVPGVNDLVATAAERLALFSELSVSWVASRGAGR